MSDENNVDAVLSDYIDRRAAQEASLTPEQQAQNEQARQIKAAAIAQQQAAYECLAIVRSVAEMIISASAAKNISVSQSGGNTPSTTSPLTELSVSYRLEGGGVGKPDLAFWASGSRSALKATVDRQDESMEQDVLGEQPFATVTADWVRSIFAAWLGRQQP